MAIIEATFDTKEKVLKVTTNGKSVKDISDVHFYRYGDEGGVELTTRTYNEDDKMGTIVRIVANDDGDMVEQEDDSVSTEDLAKVLMPRMGGV